MQFGKIARFRHGGDHAGAGVALRPLIVRNETFDKSAAGHGDIYSYGVQFVDLDPVHYTMLQNMTYEALLADRMKIV